MPEKVTLLREFAAYIFEEMERTIQGLTEDELGWKPTPESNSIGYTLRHTARIAKVLLPQVINGTTTGNWSDDYEKRGHSLGEMIRDIEEGRRLVLEGFGRLTAADLDAEMPLWGRMLPRKQGVFALLGELMHHEGQIAYIRGSWKRLHA